MKFVSTILKYGNDPTLQEGLRSWQTENVFEAALSHAHFMRPYLDIEKGGRFKGKYAVYVDCWDSTNSWCSSWVDFKSAGVIVLSAIPGGMFEIIEHKIKEDGYPLPDYNKGDAPKNEKGEVIFTPVFNFPCLDFVRNLKFKSELNTKEIAAIMNDDTPIEGVSDKFAKTAHRLLEQEKGESESV